MDIGGVAKGKTMMRRRGREGRREGAHSSSLPRIPVRTSMTPRRP